MAVSATWSKKGRSVGVGRIGGQATDTARAKAGVGIRALGTVCRRAIRAARLPRSLAMRRSTLSFRPIKGTKEIGDGINKVIGRLADANDYLLKGVIDQADFNDESRLRRFCEVSYQSALRAHIYQSLRTKNNENTIQEHGEGTFTVLTEASWTKKLDRIMAEGRAAAKREADEGRAFEVAVLAPHEIRGGVSIPLTGAVLKLNWKLVKRREMVTSARNFISNAYICDCLDPALPVVLSAVIEGKNLYAHSIGEFFLLYGRFEQKYHLVRAAQTRDKMLTLIGGNKRHLRKYIERGKETTVPLPYAVRNILSHAGSNPNRLDPSGGDLQAAIDLLKSWV